MQEHSSPKLQLTLATGAFALCFAVFGTTSAMMPMLSKQMQLTPVEKSIAVAVPVLLGSLGRIPLGMLTDRFGGRIIFSAVMVLSIIPAFLMGMVQNYKQLIAYGFLIGIALASFSVGVGFVSRWYSAERQGFTLGVYGAGNVGQSLAAFGSPFIAAAFGIRWGFWTFGVLLTFWLILFLVLARNASRQGAPKRFAEIVQPLKDSRSWVLSLYYFLTFGGFVAMAIYLPIFLTEIFRLTPQDAGFRTAGFVMLATAMRPIGGMMADRIGGRTILKYVFPATAVMAIFLTFPTMVPFTIGALFPAAVAGLHQTADGRFHVGLCSARRVCHDVLCRLVKTSHAVQNSGSCNLSRLLEQAMSFRACNAIQPEGRLSVRFIGTFRSNSACSAGFFVTACRWAF
jgi:NNP family nitrate/nitrite transporter-like MFS transporter